jgi:hypothetical protein
LGHPRAGCTWAQEDDPLPRLPRGFSWRQSLLQEIPVNADTTRELSPERFEAAMRSEPVLKLILENASTDRISALVDASPATVRSWLKARELKLKAGRNTLSR